MYTVLRVTGVHADVKATADAINAVRPGTMTPRGRKASDAGYGASVCEAADWNEHLQAIEAFIVAHREALVAASASGASIQFDTKVAPEDTRGHLYTSFGCPPSLHRELGAIGAWLVLSWYSVSE